ncbi:MAG: peptidyl-tRNA hydrolase [Bacteroidota bacterium]
MKMYILLKASVPDSFAPVIAAHASLACYKKYEEDTAMQQWIQGIFKKVVCRVNDKEFENAKKEARHIVLTESALENQEVCIAFCPREVYSKQFRFFRMWSPADIKNHPESKTFQDD